MGKLDYKVFSIAIFSISLLLISGTSQDAFAGAPTATLVGLGHAGSDGPSTFYTIDSNTGLATVVGPTGFERCSGMDVDNTGTLFATCERSDGSNTPVLITIDRSNGAGTEVGPTTLNPQIADLSFRPSDGTLFGFDGANDPDHSLVTIIPGTGIGSEVGSTGLGGDGGNGITFVDGTLYHIARDDGMHILDQSLGTASAGTALTYDPGFGNVKAMDTDVVNGLVWAIISSGDGGASTSLGIVDVDSETVTEVGPNDSAVPLDAIAVVQFDVSTPGDTYVVMGSCCDEDGEDGPQDGSLATANLNTGILSQVGGDIANQVNEGNGLSGLAIDSFGRFYVTVAGGCGDCGGFTPPSELARVDSDGNLLIDFDDTMYTENEGEDGELGPDNVNIRDLAFQPGTDILFGVGKVAEGDTTIANENNVLFKINTLDATLDLVTVLEGQQVKGIAFDPADGSMLYAVNNGCNLTIIRPDSGNPEEQEFVTETDRCYDGLGVDSLGQIFGTEQGFDSLHLIEPSDGSDVTVAGEGLNPSDVDFIVPNAVKEVHCDTEFEWALTAPTTGERGGSGHCVITYADGSESDPVQVQVSGDFTTDPTDFPLVGLAGTFHMDASGGEEIDAIWIDELGIVDYDAVSEEFADFETDTAGTAESMGIFGDLSACDVETMGAGVGLFSSSDFSETPTTRTIWIICEKPLLPDFSDDASTYPRPHLGDGRYGGGHDNGFCMDQNCMDVRSNYFNHFPETAVNQGSTHTFTLLVSCQRGADTCIHASIGGALPDSTFYDTRWNASLDKDIMTGIWTLTVTNDHGEIGTVTGTVQEVGDTFIQVSFNIQFLVPASVGTHEGDGDPHENNRHLHVTVYDNQRGMSNYIFNDGMIVEDIYAYPVVDMSFDAELEYEPLCLNEDSTMRYTCAFDKVKDWTIKNAENTLKEMYDQRGQDMDSYDESEQN